jgi:Excinuclease ATPase subunit
MKDKIIIKGAREHNLKNIDIEIPKNQFVVITGVSGSGKSSLAFDTIYSEGQRRYVESLSAYARQFIGQMQKPDVDSIEGLAPAISIEQKTTNRNPRSIVGTITEVYDYMRLLWAHVGEPHCPVCHKGVKGQTVEEIADNVIKESKDKSKLIVLAPVIKDKKGTHKNLFINLMKKGFVRVRVDGQILYLEEEIELDKNKKHNIEAVIDRLVYKEDDKEFIGRLTQAIESAVDLAEGNVIVNIDESDSYFSENYTCPDHGFSFPEINPRLFSFNAPFGACPECNGLGKKLEVNEDYLIVDENLSLNEGGIYIPGATTAKNGYTWTIFDAMCKDMKIDTNKPVKNLTKEEKDLIFYGSKG